MEPLIEPAPEPVRAEPVPDGRDALIAQLRHQIEQLKTELEYIKSKVSEGHWCDLKSRL